MTRFKGEVKNGKTLSAVWWALHLAEYMGIGADSIFTNLRGCYDHQPKCWPCKGSGIARGASLHDRQRDDVCAKCGGSGNNPTYGVYWGTTINIDDLIIDMAVEDPAEQEYNNGILVWDEAQGLLSTAATRGPAGILINSILTECGKRGMPVIFTTHLDMMVNPTARGLTVVDILCKMDRKYPNTIMWDYSDMRAVRVAQAQGLFAPAAEPKVLHHVNRLHWLYDTNEAASPFSVAQSQASGKSMTAFTKRIAAKAEQMGKPIPGLSFPETVKPPTRAEQMAMAANAAEAAYVTSGGREMKKPKDPGSARDLGGGLKRERREV